MANAYVNIFSNLAFTKYLSDSMPMEFKYLNQLELTNEVTMLYFNYFLFLFTDFVGSVETRYLVGKYYIYFSLAVICINVSMISVSIFIDNLYDQRVKKAKTAWKKFRKLRYKMARFIIHEKGEAIREILGEISYLRRDKQRKKLMRKFTYKEMEQQIIKILEEKDKAKDSALNSPV